MRLDQDDPAAVALRPPTRDRPSQTPAAWPGLLAQAGTRRAPACAAAGNPGKVWAIRAR